MKLAYFERNAVLISFTSLPITTAQHIHDMPEQAGSYYSVIVSPASTAPRRCPGLIDDNINLIPRLLPGLVDSEPQCTTLDFAIMKRKMFAFAQLSKWWPHRIVFSPCPHLHICWYILSLSPTLDEWRLIVYVHYLGYYRTYLH